MIADSNYPNHTVATPALHEHLRWRNANARHPDILAAQRRERARTRSERHQRWAIHEQPDPTRPTYVVTALVLSCLEVLAADAMPPHRTDVRLGVPEDGVVVADQFHGG